MSVLTPPLVVVSELRLSKHVLANSLQTKYIYHAFPNVPPSR